MEHILKETQDYELTFDSETYFIRNKFTGIREVNTTILVQAYKFLDEIQSGLDAYRDGVNET
jgi:hypothetical protein